MGSPTAIERYLEKHSLEIPDADELPLPRLGLKLCVVIPCLAEGDGIGRVQQMGGRHPQGAGGRADGRRAGGRQEVARRAGQETGGRPPAKVPD